MSGRLASTTRRKLRTTGRFAFAVLCGAACGLLISLGGSGLATGQEDGAKQPKQPTKIEDVKKVDHAAPLPNDAPGRQHHAKFAVPDPARLMFTKIEDFKSVASEAENPLEYAAWCEVVAHAKKFAAPDLEKAAARDLSVIELLKDIRVVYRTALLRFDGQLVCVRRLRPAQFFQDNPELGVKELFEARFIPVDESPLPPVSIVFHDWPSALAAPPPIPEGKSSGDWLDVKDAKQWIAAAGYYFKTMSVPGEQANTTDKMPVLIGRSITPLPGPPAVSTADPTAIDRDIRVFKFIKDETPMIRTAPTDVQWPEVASETRVLIHASRFTAEQLEEHALPVTFADLFTEGRTAYKLKNVKFEGRLINLRRAEVKSPELKAAGIENVFEGWLVPANEPRGNPIVITFTQPLEGVEANGRVNKWVSFAGFFFKKIRYTSQEQDPKDPTKFLDKYAPLLIGKGPIARRDPDEPTVVTWSAFVQWAIAGGVVLLVSVGALTWYYRGGDRKAKESMDAVRSRNPFDAAATNAPDTTKTP
jgi:hypothetical protein